MEELPNGGGKAQALCGLAHQACSSLLFFKVAFVGETKCSRCCSGKCNLMASAWCACVNVRCRDRTLVMAATGFTPYLLFKIASGLKIPRLRSDANDAASNGAAASNVQTQGRAPAAPTTSEQIQSQWNSPCTEHERGHHRLPRHALLTHHRKRGEGKTTTVSKQPRTLHHPPTPPFRTPRIPQIDMAAWRAQAARAEAESRTRAEEDVSRERASLKEARSALDAERGELLRRVARAEAAGQASAAEVCFCDFGSGVGRTTRYCCSPGVLTIWFGTA